MPSGRTNNFTESGRGLGHGTPTIFGSTVGYPSDSLASCYVLTRFQFNLLFSVLSQYLIPLSSFVCDAQYHLHNPVHKPRPENIGRPESLVLKRHVQLLL